VLSATRARSLLYRVTTTGVLISYSITWLGRMILPWITLATVQVAVYSRLTRGSLLDALGEDYIRPRAPKDCRNGG